MTGDVLRVAQSFQVATGIWMRYLWLGLAKVGSPTDNVVAKIYYDSSGSPGALYQTMSSYPAASLGTDMIWTGFWYSGGIPLTAGTKYWIVVERTGSTSLSDYYQVDLNTRCGYASGSFKQYVSSWAARTPDADMPFALHNNITPADNDTTAQIKDIIEDYGDSADLYQADIQTTSGISTSPVRDGSQTARYEVEELLAIGTTNFRRLLARVDINRVALIYEEPEASAAGIVRGNSDITDRYGNRIDPSTCPTALWLDFSGLIPPGAAYAESLGFNAVFIESSEYDVGTGTLRMEPKSPTSLFDFLVVRDG